MPTGRRQKLLAMIEPGARCAEHARILGIPGQADAEHLDMGGETLLSLTGPGASQQQVPGGGQNLPSCC